MANRRPRTIDEYIEAAPAAGKSHLVELYSLLKSIAPNATEVIKWGQPFFVEPRFLFAFSAHKAHLGFMSSTDALNPFREALQDFEITERGILKIPYNRPVPKTIIGKIAKKRVRLVAKRLDDNFW